MLSSEKLSAMRKRLKLESKRFGDVEANSCGSSSDTYEAKIQRDFRVTEIVRSVGAAPLVGVKVR